jgi:hypothetical protein
MCLTFRPFLLLSVEIRRRTEIKNNISIQAAMPAIEACLRDACERCAGAARSLIVLSEAVFSKELKVEVRTATTLARTVTN